MQKKNMLAVAAAFVGGIVLTLVVGWQAMPGMMLNEYSSPYGVDETVEKITTNIKQAGWTVVSVKPVHEAVASGTGVTRKPVQLIKLCQPEYAKRILRQDSSLVISAMMPCVISVYEKEDGKAYIGTRNAGMLGKMFGGDIAEVMAGVHQYQDRFIGFAI